MQFAQILFAERQFVLVWSDEAQRGQRAVDLQYFGGCKSPANFGTDGEEECNRRLHLYTVKKILSFQYNFRNICLVSTAATRVKGKAEHISNIMLVCKQFT